jgi:hypothetical protein
LPKAYTAILRPMLLHWCAKLTSTLPFVILNTTKLQCKTLNRPHRVLEQVV